LLHGDSGNNTSVFVVGNFHRSLLCFLLRQNLITPWHQRKKTPRKHQHEHTNASRNPG